MFFDDDDDVAADLRAEDAWRRRQQTRLLRNPDCRDPDHPGCEHCAEDDDDE